MLFIKKKIGRIYINLMKYIMMILLYYLFLIIIDWIILFIIDWILKDYSANNYFLFFYNLINSLYIN